MKTVGILGLGRMGYSIAARLIKSKINVLGYDTKSEAIEDFKKIGGKVEPLKVLVQQSDLIWLMVPESIVDSAIKDILFYKNNIKSDCIIVDGGNSFFKDTIRRYNLLLENDINYLDCGTSGGLHGQEKGFSLMIGGDYQSFENAKEVFEAIAYKNGYAYFGPSGAGHYVKMIHNGIEYALLHSYAEGIEILKKGYYKNLDLQRVVEVWQNGSIIRSWILDLMYDILKRDQDLHNIAGTIGGGQTGTWSRDTAKEHGVNTPMLDKSLELRERSFNSCNYADKIVALLRYEFGGHKFDKV